MTREPHAVIVQAARELCDPHGVTVEYGHGGKHAFVTLTHPDGRWWKEPIAWSPRTTGNQCDWMRQAVRRVLRGWGFDLGHEPRSHARRRERVGGGVRASEVGDPTRLASDPWAALSGYACGMDAEYNAREA